MAKVTSFDKQNLQAIRFSLNNAIAKVEEEFGIKIDIGSISYGADSFKTQLSSIINAGEVADPFYADVPADGIRELKRRIGTASFGKEIDINGAKAVLVGMKGSGTILFKWSQGSINAKKRPNVMKIRINPGDTLFGQVYKGVGI